MTASAAYVELRGIGKKYRAQAAGGAAEAHDVAVLDGVDLTIARGERIAIMGRSGSGKSTLLNILGCLDAPSTGEYLLEGRPVTHLDDEALSRVRNTSFGFVFQSFHLLAGLNILENVMLPIEYARERGASQNARTPRSTGDARARELLDMVGLAHRFAHRPNQLSGGERQRVAIARALVNEPQMLLADEPTGALDSKSQGTILELFAAVHQRFGTALVVVTHDPKVAAELGGRTLHMLDGRMAA